MPSSRALARLTALLVVAALPAVLVGQSRGIATPESVLGFRPGADYKLANYDQVLNYFRRVASESKYVQLVEAGKTTQGRAMYFALVSSPENLSKIDRYREISRRLAHPLQPRDNLSDAEAHRLAHDGKALVHIDGGLHSTEVAGGQHIPQLLYDLVSKSNEPDTKAILDNVILMLWPTINPDGQQLVADWYMQNVGTPYELAAVPKLYQEYVGHDNNRDAYMLNMVESRVLEHTWRQWEPQIIYVHHQSGPFPTRIWLPPFSEPVGSDAPYLMSREVNMMGMAIAKGLEEHGQVGATHMGTAFDAWYPGYVDYAPNFKNIAAFWTETALFEYGTPHQYTIADFPESMRDLRPRSLYASPWSPGWWRLGDAVSYMETASLSVLEFAAKYKDDLLYDRYKAGHDQIAQGLTKPPYAYFIPQQQRDPVAAVELLRRLTFGGVRVSTLKDTVTIGGESLPSGSWVIPMDQEFAALAHEVLDTQQYPDLRQYPGGPPERPYDAAGWSLPLQMGVRVVAGTSPLGDGVREKMAPVGSLPQMRIKPTPYDPKLAEDAAAFDSVPGAGFDTNPVSAAIVPPPGKIAGTGSALALDPAQNNSFRALNRAWHLGATARFAPAGSPSGARYLVTGLSQNAEADLVRAFAVSAERMDPPPDAGAQKHTRVGLYRPWSGSMDEGWTRWVLEQYGFQVVTLHPEDLGRVASTGTASDTTTATNSVDIIVFADDSRVPLVGMNPGRFPARPEHAYQLTTGDVQAIEQFVRRGGTLVCLSNASAFPIQQFKLPVKNAVSGLKPEEFFLRGSIVEVEVETSHQIMAGMPEKAAVFVDGSPVFETLDGFTGTVLARYPISGSPLLSGYLIGERYLQGRAAALDVQLGDGHVILLGFRPQWRGQPFGTFRVLFNAVLFGGK